MGGALVTGAARGIGRGIALALAGDGYNIAVHYRTSAAEAADVCNEARALGVQAVVIQGDLTDEDTVARVVDEASERIGPLKALVNNLGNYVYKPLDTLTVAEWDDMLDSNLRVTFLTCRATVPLLRAAGGGRIVNLGYAGAGNLWLTRIDCVRDREDRRDPAHQGARGTEAGNGITVNVVAPGVIRTPVRSRWARYRQGARARSTRSRRRSATSSHRRPTTSPVR